MEINLDYIGVGVNRVVNALAWGEHGGVAYAAHHMVALYDVKEAKVVSTLCGHTGMVNCVLWVPHEATPDLPPHQHLLLSGAADKTVSCWLITHPQPQPPGPAGGTASGPPPPPSWQRLAVLQGHSAPVTSIAVHRLPASAYGGGGAQAAAGVEAGAATGPQLLLVSTAGDADVIVWACCGGGDDQVIAAAGDDATHDADAAPPTESPAAAVDGAAAADVAPAGAAAGRYGQCCWRVDQRIPVGSRMQTTAALTALPLDPDWTLLATGGTDRKVTLYLRPPHGLVAGLGSAPAPSSPRFSPACVLEGHENWVRGVAFCCVEPEPTGAGSGSGRGSGGPQLLLASVSQDRYGRIWKLQPEPLHPPPPPAIAANVTGVPGSESCSEAATEEEVGSPSLTLVSALIQRYAPRPHVDTDRTRYVASCEALLIGHEDWLHGLQWAPPPAGTGTASEGATGAVAGRPGSATGCRHSRASAALLTASMDRTMIVWRFEAASGLWMNEAALGDAGASCLGYFGGVWGPGGAAILAHGFTGALHLWRQPERPSASPSPPGGPWLPRHALGGHFGPVADLGWGLDGACLISVGEDQTARVHAAVSWRRQGRQRQPGDGMAAREQEMEEGEEAESPHWCEIARAQIHGHDFRCVAPVASPAGRPYMFASGSEEKVLRVLESPQAFIDTLVALRGGEGSPGGAAIRREARRGAGFGAAVAALGLSNKAVEAAEGPAEGPGYAAGGADYAEGPDFVPCAAPQVVSEPPLEEHLAQNTLWPETHKLYGHGNDVFCAAASPDGRLLASACKAQTAATAAIWVWCTASWRPLAQLRAHTLTVTQLEWSPSGGLLAAASRDRTFSIYRRHDPTPAPASDPQQQQPGAEGGSGRADGRAPGEEEAEGDATFELVARVKGAHGRVIWSVSWSLDEQLIATASRDDTVKVWRLGGVGAGAGADGALLKGEAAAAATAAAPMLAAALPQFPCAATAVAFAPRASRPAQTRAITTVDSSSDSPGVSAVQVYRGSYLLAVGLESGSVQLWGLAAVAAAGGGGGGAAGLAASCVWSAGEPWRHAAAVRRLRWRGTPGSATAVPKGSAGAAAEEEEEEGEEGGRELQLASGSEDHSVRVFAVRSV